MIKKQIPEFFQLDRYQISPKVLAQSALHCDPEEIHARVIIMPNWRADIFSLLAEVQVVVENQIYTLVYQEQKFSVIRSGIGAPQTGDTILALAATPCEVILFTGSVGGLRPGMSIGDLVLPTTSIIGDGFTRYLDPAIQPNDLFGQSSMPDQSVFELLRNHTISACSKEQVALHEGIVFSTDSIVAQFFRLEDWSSRYNCIGVEMETAAAFRAASLVGIPIAALLQISDVPVLSKSLFSGRTIEERDRRTVIRQTILARILLDTLVLL